MENQKERGRPKSENNSAFIPFSIAESLKLKLDHRRRELGFSSLSEYIRCLIIMGCDKKISMPCVKQKGVNEECKETTVNSRTPE